MTTTMPNEQSKATILFVDDEKMALKYFLKTFDEDYEILTADNVDAGWEIVQQRYDDLAVIVTDQRMPGRTGVELLHQARTTYPSIVRILTTAYAELDSAIQSVNDGAIYQYVLKPWDLRELGLVLQRAVSLYRLQAERDSLLASKLSMLQRLSMDDRVANLSVLTGALESRFRDPLGAASAYVDAIPGTLLEQDGVAEDATPYWAEIAAGGSGQEPCLMVKVARQLTRTLDITMDEPSDIDTANLLNDVASACNAASDAISVNVSHGDDTPSSIHGVPELLVAGLTLATTAVARSYSSPPALKIHTTAVNDSQIALSISPAGAEHGSADNFKTVFSLVVDKTISDASIDLFAAFILVHHHGGSIQVGDGGNAWVISLPLRAVTDSPVADDSECLQHLRKRFAEFDVLRYLP